MIIITHYNEEVTDVLRNGEAMPESQASKLLPAILELAHKFPSEMIVWVSQELAPYLNRVHLEKKPVALNELHSYEPQTSFMGREIGYVEDTLFVNVNKKVKYPTWLQSANTGVIQASTLLALKTNLSKKSTFVYFLNAVAKAAMIQGLRCYSNPQLLLDGTFQNTKGNAMSMRVLYTFIRQHYKKRWLFLVPFQLLIFEKRFTFLTAFLSVFTRKHSCSFSPTDFHNHEHLANETIDVIIPTMGRKQYLYDVLVDLKNQALVPTSIIIIEQNADTNAKSQLDYLAPAQWPFKIVHSFIHQTGACNARNIALEKVTADWVFFADDDVRIPKNALSSAISIANSLDVKAITLSCLQAGEKEPATCIKQWIGFGSGTSIVHKEALRQAKFDMGYEHGHGEDGDFGMQIRNNGFDVLYVPFIQLAHLKAPVGGFRQKHINEWDTNKITPKPSPTVMLYKLKYLTKEQLNSYKFTLITKYFKSQSVKNPVTYLKKMSKAWKESLHWANHLNNTTND